MGWRLALAAGCVGCMLGLPATARRLEDGRLRGQLVLAAAGPGEVAGGEMMQAMVAQAGRCRLAAHAVE